MTENKRASVKVLLLDVKEMDAGLYGLFFEKASEVRRKRALRFQREEDSRKCIMAEALVRYAYRTEKGCTDVPEIIYPKQGKPKIDGEEGFYFSISHSRYSSRWIFIYSQRGVPFFPTTF